MITVLGGTGFIGSHLVRHLQREGIAHRAPARAERLDDQPLGDVIDCAGLTADFRGRPTETIDAHVTRVQSLVQTCTFDSYLYLSSTRVYRHIEAGIAREDDAVPVHPDAPDDLYNLSKLMGESIILRTTNGRIARLSNVDGPDASSSFLAQIRNDARTRGAVELETSLDSEKDYISIDVVVPLLVAIALRGKQRIYNVASGTNTTTRALIESLGCSVTVAPNAPTIRFPRIDITRIREEFGA
ncbi:MAG TPA: SDR family oxidoreductase [Thermoanaerobaculia bacterium]